MTSDTNYQSPDDQVQRLLFNLSGDIFMEDSTPLALPTHSVSESGSPAENPFTTSSHSDQFAPFDYDMKDFQVHDEIPLTDPLQDFYSQPPQVSYPYVDYQGYTPYPEAYLPGPYSGPVNGPCSFFPYPPQSQDDAQVFPPTPATTFSSSTPAAPVADHTNTPTKASTKPKKKTRTSKSDPSKGKAKEKSFPCPYPDCPRVSTCASNLADHLLTHTNVRDYPCEYIYENGQKCTKRFPRPWGLHRHYGDTHKMDVKVQKKNGLRKGTTKKQSGMSVQQPLPDGLPPTLTGQTSLPPATQPENTSLADGRYTPPPTGRPPRINNAIRINIRTQGPSGPFPCCGMIFDDGNAFMVHNHLHHAIPNSSFCCCDDCENARAPAFNGTMDIDSSNIDPELLLLTPATHRTHDPMSCSPALSNSSMDEAPVYTPTESLSDAKPCESLSLTPSAANIDTDTDMFASASDTSTFDAQDFSVHCSGPVFPLSFYCGMGLDYNNMSQQGRREW